MAGSWLPLSILQEGDAEDFASSASSLLDGFKQKVDDGNRELQRLGQQAQAAIPKVELPSLDSLTPWAQQTPADDPAEATGQPNTAASQDTTPRPSNVLPSLETLTPWAKPADTQPERGSAAAIPQGEAPTGPGLSSPGTQTAGAGAPSSQAPAVGSGQNDDAEQAANRAYAREAAQRAGIDPDIFERQMWEENKFRSQGGSSAGAQGVAQIVPAAHPGVDVTNPRASLDYAANLMKSHLASYGGDIRKALQAYNAGPGNVASGAADSFAETNKYLSDILGGSGGRSITGDRTALVGDPAGNGRADGAGNLVGGPSVVDQAALDDPDKWALCGPVAAVLAAASHGADWTVAQAKGIASKLGLWDADQGMHGLDSEVTLLQKAGVNATTGDADEARLAADAMAGNTPIVSTDGHYFVLQGYNKDTHQFDTGSTGTVYRGGSRWLTLDDMQRLSGTIQGAAYIDNPASPSPSVVASKGSDLPQSQALERSGADTSGQDSTYGAFDPPGYGQQTPDQPSEMPQPKSFLDNLGQGIGDLSNNLTSGLNKTAADVQQGIGDAAQGVGNALQGTVDKVASVAEQVPGAVRNVADTAIGAKSAREGWDRQSEIDNWARDNGYQAGAFDPRFRQDYPDLRAEFDQLGVQLAMGATSGAPEFGALDAAGRAIKVPVPAHLGGPGAAPLPAPIQRVADAVGGIRDAGAAMTRGLPGGAPVASVVDGGNLGGMSESAPRILTPEEFRNLDFKVPEGGSSITPKRAFDWRARGEEFETIHDLANQTDRYRVMEALGKGWPDLGPTSITLLSKIRRDEPITVYRARPTEDIAGGAILPGSYVTESKWYAQNHGEGILGGDFKIAEMQVRPSELMTYGDPHEFIYVPKDLNEAHARYAAQVRAPDPTLAAEADRFSAGRQQAGQAPGLGVVPQSDRYYHGTGSAFDTPNPAHFDENGLFGPGYYVTSDPRVAGSYGEARAPQLSDEAYANLQTRVEQLRGSPEGSANALRLQNNEQLLADETARRQGGPNVRAVDVPRGLRLLDADKPATPQSARELYDAVATVSRDAANDLAAGDRWQGAAYGQAPTRLANLYEDARSALTRLSSRDPNWAPGKDLTLLNGALERAGYDGIRYDGGQRIPMQDEAGNAIEHQATVIFPSSLDKITNATSGMKGGIVAFDPGHALAGAVQGAVGGGVAGGYEASQQDNPSPQDIAKGMIGGAILGTARQQLGRRGTGQAVARAVERAGGEGERSYNPADYFLHTASAGDLNKTGIDYSFPGGQSPVWMSEGSPYTRGGSEMHVYGVRKDALDPSRLDTAGAYPKYEGVVPPDAIVPLGKVTAEGSWERPFARAVERGPKDVTGADLNSVSARVDTPGALPPVSPPLELQAAPPAPPRPPRGVAAPPPPPEPPGGGGLVTSRPEFPAASPDAELLNHPNPAIRATARMLDNPQFQGPGMTLGTRLENARRAFVKQVSDRDVYLSEAQKRAQSVLGGKPLPADMLVSELKRLQADPAAAVHVDEGIRPAVQAVGKDLPALQQVLIHNDNLDVAASMGLKARDASLTKAGENPTGLQVGRAQAAQFDAENYRKFSGGLNANDSEQALADLEKTLGPERWGKVQDAAQQLWDHVDQLRQRMVATGVWSPELAASLKEQYPHYMPTRILDYLNSESGVAALGGKSLSVTNNGLKRLTMAGTERARQDPIASLVTATYETERLARKNATANAFLKVVQADPQFSTVIREVPSAGPADFKGMSRDEQQTLLQSHRDASRLLESPDYIPLKAFVDGKPVTYAVPKVLEEIVKNEPRQVLGGWAGAAWNTLVGGFRAAATSKNPAFLAGNALNDAAAYTIRESGRAGLGPLSAPKALADLSAAYLDSFKGLLDGTFHGDTARYLKEGGGQFGFFSGTPEAAKQTVDAMQRRSVFEIKGPADLKRLALDLVTLKPVTAVGERIELAPRVAAMQRAEQRGADQVRSVIAGRDVTIDFSRGGEAAKVINQFIPFFNVGIQGAATVSRALKENPKGFLATTVGLLGAPVMAAEAWNRGHNLDGSTDQQRAQDYSDVPQYAKDAGVVIMLPGEAPLDQQGNRRPQYVYFRLREWAPFATMAREAAARFAGDDPRGWQELAGTAVAAASPVQSFSSVLPTGISTAVQLQNNRDFYRQRDIATKSADEQASVVGQAAAGPFSAVRHAITGDPNADVRPSQVDFALKDYGAGLAGAGLAAANTVAGQPDARGAGLPAVPVAGGFAGRLVGNQIGGQMETARQNMIPESLQSAARDIGLNPADLATPVGSLANGVPLSRAEQTRYQELTNTYLGDAVDKVTTSALWTLHPAQQEKMLRDAITQAKAKAADEMLRGISAPERRDRINAEIQRSRKAG